MKRNIFLISMLVMISSIYAGINDNVDSLYNVALNQDVGYLSASDDVSDALDNLEADPLYYDSSISLNSKVENSSNVYSYSSTLSLDVPLSNQLSLDANIDTNLDGSIGFTYSPLTLSESNVSEDVTYENSSLYLEEYEDNLKIDITQAYLNYLISIESLDLQEAEVELYKEKYYQQKALHEFDEATLIEVQEALFDYNDSKNDISEKELDVYKNRISLIELIGVENSENIIILETDINEIVELVEAMNELLSENNYSVMNTYEVVKALNNTITLEDSYNSMKLYDPTFNISGDLSTDGDFSATLYFKTSFDDFNGDEKKDLLNDIEISRLEATNEINLVQNKIEILEREIGSNKQQIQSIQNQIEDNNLVMNEASSLLALGEYEDLSYQELLLNENNLKLSLIEAYVDLYINQLTLYNYI